jgi:hypothetical protein
MSDFSINNPNYNDLNPNSNNPNSNKIELTDILMRQNYISENIMRNQAFSLLPQHEPDIFSGEDITAFRSFILTFEKTIEQKCFEDSDKYYYLLKYTSGAAKDIVKSCFYEDTTKSFRESKKMLHKTYGNEYQIAHRYLEKIYNWSQIKAEDVEALSKFTIYLTNCNNIMSTRSPLNQLNSWKEIREIVLKLPFRLREQFRRLASVTTTKGNTVDFGTLVSFLNEQVEILKFPFLGDISDPQRVFKPKVTSKKTFCTGKSVQFTKSEFGSSNKCPCCQKTNHILDDCYFFARKTLNEKQEFIKTHKLCFGCLRSSDHFSKNCKRRLVCKKCHKNHPTSLHKDYEINDSVKQNEIPISRAKTSNSKPETEHSFKVSHDQRRTKIMCPSIPVLIRNPVTKNTVLTYMGLDNFSTASYIDCSLLKTLNTDGVETKISLTTMEGKLKPITAKIVRDLTIVSLDSTAKINIPKLYAKSNWPFTIEDSPKEGDIEGISGLENIPFKFIDKNIGLLIGMDMPDILKPLDVVSSTSRGPFATRYMHGWALSGPMRDCNVEFKCFKTKTIEETETIQK